MILDHDIPAGAYWSLLLRAGRVLRLTALGDAATAQRTMTSEMQAVRRAIERDRYGLVSQVLLARERCSPGWTRRRTAPSWFRARG